MVIHRTFDLVLILIKCEIIVCQNSISTVIVRIIAKKGLT